MMQADSQISIAVCDDTQNDLEQIAVMTGEILREAEIPCAISVYGSGRDLLRDIRDGKQVHILLLDVMMDELGGMDLAATLREMGSSSATGPILSTCPVSSISGPANLF